MGDNTEKENLNISEGDIYSLSLYIPLIYFVHKYIYVFVWPTV